MASGRTLVAGSSASAHPATSQKISGQRSALTMAEASQGASAMPQHTPDANALMPKNRAGPGGIRFTVSRDEVTMPAQPSAMTMRATRKVS
ncbi:hypothetical protein D3C86_1915480 [compost metagenome]